MSASLQDNDELQLTAYCDGELDPAAAGEFERRLAADELLKARYARLMSLRQAVRALPQADVPSDLQARIQARLKAETERSNVERAPSNVSNVTVLRRRSWSFQALAASAVLGAVISGSVLKTIDRFGQEDTIASEVVAGHIRGLLAPQPFDIASSDRHTVKPWFTSRLPEISSGAGSRSKGFCAARWPGRCDQQSSGGNDRLQACGAYGEPYHAAARANNS